MKIAFNNVQRQSLRHKKKLIASFSSVLKNGLFFNGREHDKFKKNLTSYLGDGEVTLVASGHDSLLLALQSLGCTTEDEVIIPANVYPTAFPTAISGAKPVLVDVDKNGLIDMDHVKRAITKKTKAVIAVHLYGLVVDIDALRKSIRDTGIKIIEDCAQAFGSLYKNRPVGTLGDIGCFSFYPTKNIGALGDGGALWTRHKKLSIYFESAKQYGERKRYKSTFISGHSRLPELQAAGLNIYMNMFQRERKSKKEVLRAYKDALNKRDFNGTIRLLYHDHKSDPLIHLLVIQARNRNALQKYLENKGVSTLIQYPNPVHKVHAFRHLNKSTYPRTEELTKSILSLPFHSSLTKNQIDYIVRSVYEFYKKRNR